MIEDREFISRQAECATMLVAISRMLLNVEPSEFAAWLRMIADDIEAAGVEAGLGLRMAANDVDGDIIVDAENFERTGQPGSASES